MIAPHGIALDGLLAAASVRAGAELQTAHLNLPLKTTGEIWHASELHFLGPAQSYPVPYIRSLNPEKWERRVFQDRRGNTINKVVTRDELKNLLDKYEAIATPGAVAWGVGDIDRVRELMGLIEAVGKKAISRMAGRIVDITVERIEGDPTVHGLLDNNALPLRNLPIALYEGLGGNPEVSTGAAVCRLPRWKNRPEHCALPSSRFIRMNDIA